MFSLWRNLVHRDRVERDLNEEVRAAFELLVDEKVQAGMRPEDARRTATLELGRLEAVKEQVRHARAGAVVDTFLQDLRYAGRTLRRNPGFTVVAVLTLALGIGANSAIFSIVHAVLLRELPYSEPHELVMIWESRPQEGVYDNVVSPADFLDWRARQEVFESIAATWSIEVNLSGSGEPERVGAGNVSASFFKVLGVAPALGRDFSSDQEQTGRNRVVILNHGFWQRRFGGNPDIVGAPITLNGQPYDVIGVLPVSFRFPDESIDLWYPIDFTTEENRERFNHFLNVFARLKAGVTIERAQQNMDLISAQLQREVVLQNQGHGAHVVPLRDQLVGDVRSALLVLMAAVGFILLIACLNVANLLLARGASRGREVALRSALGAGRGRVVQQLVIECLCLAGLGAIAAVPVTIWGVATLKSFVPAEIPRLNDAGLSLAVTGFMVAVALVTAALFSLAPALQLSNLNLTDALKERHGMSAGLSRQRIRRALVVAEVALAFVLLVGAGLMTRTLVNLLTIDAGFVSENVLTIPITLAGTKYVTPQQQAVFFGELLDRVRAQPGVHSAGYTSHLPMSGEDSRAGIGIEGRAPDPSDEPTRAHWRVITPGYFSAMRIRLIRGRFPTESETRAGVPVSVINRTAAERYWPGVDPIGKRFRIQQEWREIVGVVDDVRHWGPASPVNPEVYLPSFWPRTNLVVRAAQDPVALTTMVREQVRRLSSTLPLASIRTMDEIRGRSVGSPRFYLVLLGIFGSVALMLAVIGVYGVISYTVAQRQVDIGIRMALGAHGKDVVRMFIRQGLVLTGTGLALGAVGAFALTRLMTALLFGVTPTDAPTFAAMAVLMGIVALAACYAPARRAATLDPLTALRHE
ncbi:MAG: FtsX-like permease family protein [Luteitalea sp.]|nr:FtsX-like permease family protein [Luteitalea sp.]